MAAPLASSARNTSTRSVGWLVLLLTKWSAGVKGGCPDSVGRHRHRRRCYKQQVCLLHSPY